MDCGLTKFADDAKFGETVDTPEGRLPSFRVIQTGWRHGPNGNLTKFKKAKRQVLQLGRKDPLQRYRLGSARLAGEQICRSAPGMVADSELGMSQKRAWAAGKAVSIQGCINRVTAHRLRERVIHLYT